MKIYLAGSWARQAEMRRYRTLLTARGHVVTSHWIDQSGESFPADVAQRHRAATIDVYELRLADVVLCFTDPPGQSTSRGGRHVELGYALGRGIHCVLIGEAEHIFHALLPRYPTLEAWLNGDIPEEQP